ncbi:MAG: aldose 1-epimerase [Gammaproteobacteria bacterium]|nr:aldose 1-epimerase [Gammaproteobacteria bacterium]
MTTRIELRAGEWRAAVAPSVGGAIVELSRRDRAILRPTPDAAVAAQDVRRTGAYPLVPYANRIAFGRFGVGGRSYRLRGNFPEGAHPLHGVGWQRRWQVTHADETGCELRLEHRPTGEDALDWPFAFEAIQRVAVDPQGLRIELLARNLEAFPVPLGIGWHPLFPRRDGQHLEFAADGWWRNGDDALPLEAIAGLPWDAERGLAVGDRPLDNDFFGWRGEARLVEPDGLAVRIVAAAPFPVLRVFVPAGRDFLGVEPVSHVADAVNRPTLRSGGMSIVAPGERIGGLVTVGAERCA